MFKKYLMLFAAAFKPGAKLGAKIADEMVVVGRSLFLAGMVSPIVPTDVNLMPLFLMTFGSIMWTWGLVLCSRP